MFNDEYPLLSEKYHLAILNIQQCTEMSGIHWDLNLEFQMLVALQLTKKFEWLCEPEYCRAYVLNTMSSNGWKRAY